MKVVRDEEHNRARVVHVQEQGKEPEIRIQLGDHSHIAMTIGEATGLRDDMTRAIQRGAPSGMALAQCSGVDGQKCDKIATTVIAGKGYCDEHAKKVAR